MGVHPALLLSLRDQLGISQGVVSNSLCSTCYLHLYIFIYLHIYIVITIIIFLFFYLIVLSQPMSSLFPSLSPPCHWEVEAASEQLWCQAAFWVKPQRHLHFLSASSFRNMHHRNSCLKKTFHLHNNKKLMSIEYLLTLLLLYLHIYCIFSQEVLCFLCSKVIYCITLLFHEKEKC